MNIDRSVPFPEFMDDRKKDASCCAHVEAVASDLINHRLMILDVRRSGQDTATLLYSSPKSESKLETWDMAWVYLKPSP